MRFGLVVGEGRGWSWSVIGNRLADRLYRRRAARHLSLALAGDEARRGDEIEVTLTVADPKQVGERLEAGVVCTERYDEQSTDTKGRSSRITRDAVAYESWLPADRTQVVQTFSFAVPADAPFSYEGKHLSFAWHAVAREPTPHRPDPTVRLPVRVLP